MFNIKNISKKLLICSVSLVMMSSLASGTVSAKHVHHSHTRVARIAKHTHNHKSLRIGATNKSNQSFKKLLNWMNKDYYLYLHTHPKTFEKNQPIMNKYCNKIYANLKHNWNIYTSQQMNQIAHMPDARITTYGSFYSITDAINDKNFYYTNHVNKLSQQDNEFDTEIRSYLVNDINQTRVNYGRKPLIATNVMQQVANYRAPKVQYAYDHLSDYMNYPHNTSNPTDAWVHGEDTHNDGGDYLENHGYSSHDWGANAGNWGYKFTTNGDGIPSKYPNDTPEHIAGNIDDGIINHDNCEGNYNGHRKNELDSEWKYLGVGVTYNPQTQQGSFNEQFAE